jgi:aarF domain-containing kinase
MAPKPFNFPAKRTTAIFLLTATAAAAAVATANSDNLSPLTADKIRAQIHGIVRTTRAVSTVSILLIFFFNSSRCSISLIPLSIFNVSGCFHRRRL